MAPRQYELTQEQLDKLLDASKPVPYMIIGGVPPRSPQENANEVWRRLGQELGFDWRTVRPVAGGDQHLFTAEPTGDGR